MPNKDSAYQTYYVPMDIVFKYAQECPISFSKCESFQEVKDKINRMANLGKQLFIFSKSGFKYYQYHAKTITTFEGKIWNIQTEEDEYYHVSEYQKQSYDKIVQKIII